MGLISLCTFIAVTVAFVTGRIVAVSDSSDNDNDVLAFVVTMFFLIVSVSLPIGATYLYVENKEYSSSEYNLEYKIVTIEEYGIEKKDTIYVLTRKDLDNKDKR